LLVEQHVPPCIRQYGVRHVVSVVPRPARTCSLHA
jgi:hypothetical protein